MISYLPAVALPLPGDTVYLWRDLSQYSVKELERLSGKKFTLKQKIAVKFLQKGGKKARKLVEEDPQGNLSFISALIVLGSLSLLFLPNLSSFFGALFLVIVCATALLALWMGLRSKRKRGKTFKNMFGIIVGGGVIIIAIILSISALTM